MTLFLQCRKKWAKLGCVGAVALALGLLGGCASDTPRLVTAQAKHYKKPHHSYTKSRHKRANSRSYRVNGITYHPMASAHGYSETGLASWYGSESGSKTATGAHFSPEGISAAHKTLPLPSKVRVTNLHNGRSIVLVVNDRGPFKKNRIIDLSHGAAKRIGLNGLAKVKVDYLGGVN